MNRRSARAPWQSALASLLFASVTGCSDDAREEHGSVFAGFDASGPNVSAGDSAFDAGDAQVGANRDGPFDAARDTFEPIDGSKDAAQDVPDAPTDSSSDAAADSANQTIRVLFVGNSYTFQNDLPGWVGRLAVSSGRTPLVETASRAAGGATLQDHWNNPDTVASVGDGTWDFVVLQGQSYEPLTAPIGFLQHAQWLANTATGAGATPVFFETWARADSSPDYAQWWSGGSPSAMQEGLRERYGEAAEASGGIVAPVGDTWEIVLNEHPGIILHSSDGSHPNRHGTYLAACVFYSTLTGNPSLNIADHPASVSDSEALTLQTVADSHAP